MLGFYGVSFFFVLSGIVFFFAVLWFIYNGHRERMKIMDWVWPLTMLWSSWIGLWFYGYKHKKQVKKQMDMQGMDMSNMKGMDMKDMKMDMSGMMHMDMSKKVTLSAVAVATLHCGAGCTLADLIGEWFTYWIPISIGGSFVAGSWVVDYLLALIIGVYFQYLSLRPMEPNNSVGKTVIKALKVDFFSLTSWQIGMYGWMAIVIWAINDGNPLPKDSWEFWFYMQIAMLCGFLTAFPTNKILIKMGIKHAM
ncbi:MAG: DUF4396 domain-containing protein [Marinifilaceae bacterium]